MDTLSYNSRNVRQLELVDETMLLRHTPVVIGCGAIGSHLVRLLAHLGVPRLVLVDPDTVGPENLGLQGFRERKAGDQSDLGQAKVDALAEVVAELAPAVTVTKFPDLFALGHLRNQPDPVIFLAVDQIAARQEIFSWVQDLTAFLVDGRMGGRKYEVYVADETDREFYPTTLFAPEEQAAFRCTAVGTCATAVLPAVTMLNLYVNYLNGCRLAANDQPVSVHGDTYSCEARTVYRDQLDVAAKPKRKSCVAAPA